MLIIHIFTIIKFFVFPVVDGLLFPDKATSIGLVASVSVPITELLPERRFLIDWCFQISYDLPGSVSAFYNIPIWPIKSKIKRDIDVLNDTSSRNISLAAEKYFLNETFQRHPYDFSAEELYNNIEIYLSSFGYHKTCLLRIICELAQHPFDDNHQNLLTDIITFLLTPSWHQGFDISDKDKRQKFEDAEMRGFFGENCSKLYIDCDGNILNYITNVFIER